MIINATTTITVIRTSSSAVGDGAAADVIDRLQDSYSTSAGGVPTMTLPPAAVAAGVRANIGSPGGTEQILGGNQETMSFRMQCDPVELWPTDQVVDENTRLVYDVVTSAQRTAFKGREYTQATLSRSRGAA
jgi:hypothetical protein